MSKNLEKLNKIAPEIAEVHFLNCCGSQKWAKLMEQARPFTNFNDLLKKAKQIWPSLSPEDWLEAFAAHPKIGSRQAAPKQQSRSAEWSKGEQSGAKTAAASILDQLAEANNLYEKRFGYIFIVCATGKSAEEMLEICRKRLSNDPEKEIFVAAEEQQKITQIRLEKLLDAGF